MKTRTQVLIFDKIIDMLVVVFGVLIALGVGSCVEDRGHRADWGNHKRIFTKSIIQTKKTYEENIKGLDVKIEKGENLAEIIVKVSKVPKKEFGEYLKEMSFIKLDAAVNHLLFESFTKSKNPYFMENFERLVMFEEFFYFKEVAKIYGDLYMNQILPEILDIRKKMMNEKFIESKTAAKEIKFLTEFHLGFIRALKFQYEEQVKTSDKLLQELKND